jgi:hypothetical protein
MPHKGIGILANGSTCHIVECFVAKAGLIRTTAVAAKQETQREELETKPNKVNLRIT